MSHVDHPPPNDRPTWMDQWDNVSRQLRTDHGELTDVDLSHSRGQEDDLFRRLGSRLGRSEQQARAMLKDQRDRTTGADQATRTDTPVDGHAPDEDDHA